MRRRRLTPRELEVLELAQAGLPVKVMADQLGIRSSTVNVHMKSIFRKLEVGSRAALIARLSIVGTEPADDDASFTRRSVELSPRERQTLDLLVTGLSAKRMADVLGISVHTVNQYTKSIFRKFGVGSRGALLAFLTGRGTAAARTRVPNHFWGSDRPPQDPIVSGVKDDTATQRRPSANASGSPAFTHERRPS